VHTDLVTGSISYRQAGQRPQHPDMFCSSTHCRCYNGSMDIQRSELNSALRTLDIIINGIPNAFPDGSIDGPLAQYFTGIDFDNEFPYKTVDTQWTCVFKREWTQEQLQIQACLVLLSALKQLWLLRGFPKWSCTASRTSSHVMTKTVHYASGKYIIELEKQYVLNFSDSTTRNVRLPPISLFYLLSCEMFSQFQL
jgi:hypothetical protein